MDESGLLLYEPFYGFAEKPFSLSTDPRFLFKSGSHTPVFHDVLAGIRRREGLVVLTGEIGMGKTTLCRSVLASLDRKTFAAFVPDPFVSREDLLKTLLVEFAVVSVDDLVQGRLRGASRAELSYTLYEFLRSLEPLDAFAVLVIDEAQNLPASLLEEIRILADLEGTRKLLQVVLIGQPELSRVLREPHMRQVKQRVTTHCELHPLDRQGVHGYVGHRLTVAGAPTDRRHFAGEAIDLVFEASGGVPRVVNRLCDWALQRGHRARASTIGPELVRQAMADLQLTPSVVASEAPVAVVPPPAPLPVPPAPVPVAAATEGAPATAAPPARSRAAMATAALVVLGAISGVSLAGYWVWAAPMIAARGDLPAVQRPPIKIAAPLPDVMKPAIEAVGEEIAPPQVPDEPAIDEYLEALPARPLASPAAQPVWVVQVGTFADDARANALIEQLAARKFTAFKSVSAMRNGAPLHLVLVGPFAARPAAAVALDRIEEIPGIGRPLLQLVPPAVGPTP
jgi:type II secretory pathway predicted ATPase ExeA/cell division septation protein DedD